MGELLHTDLMYARVKDIVEWKNLTVAGGYHHEPITTEETIDYLKTYGEPLKDYICDVGLYLNNANKEGKKIMFEAQLGASATSTSASIPIRRALRRSQHTLPSARAFPISNSTNPSAS